MYQIRPNSQIMIDRSIGRSLTTGSPGIQIDNHSSEASLYGMAWVTLRLYRGGLIGPTTISADVNAPGRRPVRPKRQWDGHLEGRGPSNTSAWHFVLTSPGILAKLYFWPDVTRKMTGAGSPIISLGVDIGGEGKRNAPARMRPGRGLGKSNDRWFTPQAPPLSPSKDRRQGCRRPRRRQ